MSGDIVERLTDVDESLYRIGAEWERNVVRDAAAAIEARDAEIVYLRTEFSAVLGDAIAKDAEIVRLRAAGDALAQGVLDEHQPFPNDQHINLWWLVANWQEARRER